MMRLTWRILVFLIYFLFGVIAVPFIAYTIFLMTLPNFWNKIGQAKKRERRSLTDPIKEAMKEIAEEQKRATMQEGSNDGGVFIFYPNASDEEN